MSDSTGALVTRMYSGFRGVDFRGDEINLIRSPDSLNVWKDYKETESIRTRPGMELSVSFPASVYGIFFYKDYTLVHSGKNLYTVTSGGKKTIIFSDSWGAAHARKTMDADKALSITSGRYVIKLR